MSYAKGYLLSSVAVAPTTTTMVGIDCIDTSLVTIAVKNSDVTQRLSCSLKSRMHREIDWAPSSLPDLSDIGPGETRSVQVDVRGLSDLLLEGVASGAGLTALVTASARTV